MDVYRFVIKENDPGKIYTPGISHGYGVGSRVDLLHKVGKYMVIRFPGASDWSGVGMSPEYYGAEYLLCEIVCFQEGSKNIETDFFKVLERCQPARFWRACKKDYIKMANDLAAQEEG